MKNKDVGTTKRKAFRKLSSIGLVAGIMMMSLGMTAAPASASDQGEPKLRGAIAAALDNSANHILQAYADGDLAAGSEVADIKDVAPDALKVDPGMRMGIVFIPDHPSYFSLCGWTADGAITQDKAVAYKSVTGTTSPMPIDCSNNFGGVNPILLDVVEDGTVKKERPEGLDFPVIDTAEVEAEAAPAYQAPAPEPAAPAEPEEPLDTKPFIIGGSILLGLAVLIGIGFTTYFLSRKVRLNSQQNSINSTQWAELVSRCDEIVKKWASYELDPAKILDFPLLSDMREELTRQFHSALRRAKHLRPEDINKVKGLPALGSPFAKAVDDLEAAFLAAETEAKRIRWNHFSPDERKRLQRAKDLLYIALNEGASENERQAAYKRMQKELEGLIVVPEATVLTLTERVNLQLTDGRV